MQILGRYFNIRRLGKALLKETFKLRVERQNGDLYIRGKHSRQRVHVTPQMKLLKWLLLLSLVEKIFQQLPSSSFLT